MGDFVFNLSPNIIAGTDVLISLGENVAKYGSRFMLIVDPLFKNVELLIKLKQSLEQKGLKLFTFDAIEKSPDAETVMRALKLGRAACVDAVIVVGDVVACSVAKAVVVLYDEKESIYNYLEGKPLENIPIPLIQIPTTSDNPFLFSNTIYLTDSRNKAVSALKVQNELSSMVFFDSCVFKNLSLNSLRLMIFSSIAASLDAYVSRKANFFSDALLKKAIFLFVMALDAEHDRKMGQTIEETLVQAFVLEAVAQASSSVGVAVATSTVCNGKYGISFSASQAIMLREVLRDSIHSNLKKVAEVAELFYKSEDALNENLESVVVETCKKIQEQMLNLELPAKIESLELDVDDMTCVAEAVLKLDFVNYIPRAMTSLDILELLKKAY